MRPEYMDDERSAARRAEVARGSARADGPHPIRDAAGEGPRELGAGGWAAGGEQPIEIGAGQTPGQTTLSSTGRHRCDGSRRPPVQMAAPSSR